MKVKILTSVSDKMQGVKGKSQLDTDELYVFCGIYSHDWFHMKGVEFPIEIAFVDQEGGILAIEHMEPEIGKACAPEGTSLAVEASQGYFNQHDLKVGDVWKELFNKIS